MKVIIICALISLVRGGYINQLQAVNSYTNSVQHPAGGSTLVAAPVQPVQPLLVRTATAAAAVSSASSSVNVNTNQAANAIVAGPQYVAAAPIATTVIQPQPVRVEPYDPNPHYTYAYDVNDPHTGDSKNQHESRAGDVVRGQYSVQEPDGSRRTVDYSADPHNGFNAVVRRTAPALRTVVQPLVAAAYYPTPQQQYVVNAH